MNKQSVGPTVVVVALLMGLGWWFLNETENQADEATAPAHSTDERVFIPSLDEPSDRSGSGPTPNPVVSAPFSPRTEAKVGPLIPLVPNYGPLIERHSAIVEIQLMDADGLPLLPIGFKNPQLRVWRREGDVWLQAPGRFDFKRSVLLAGRGNDSGLEPGEHEVAVSLGSYGTGSAKFTVGSDAQDQNPVIQLKGRRRWITLDFADKAGHPVPYISDLPRFYCAETRSIPNRRSALPPFLLDPPSQQAEFIMMDEEIEEWDENNSHRDQRIPTDNGTFRLQVIAGAAGTLRVNFNPKLFATQSLEVKSPFDQAEWERYPVSLELNPTYAQRVKKFAELVLGSIRSSSSAEPRPAVDPFDVSTLSPTRTRVIVTAREGGRLQPLHSAHASSPMQKLDLPGRPTWYRDYFPHNLIKVTASDRAFFRPPPQELEHQVGSVLRIALSAGPLPCRLEAQLTPTLSAWTRALSFALHGKAKDGIRIPKGAHQTIRRAERNEDRFHYETSLTADWAAKLSEPTTLVVGISRHGREVLRYSQKRIRWSDQLVPVEIPISAAMSNALRSGSLQFNLRQQLKAQAEHPWLVFRAVGDHEEGLPWAHGSVVRASEEATAQACREVLVSIATNQQLFELPKAHKELLGLKSQEPGVEEPPPEFVLPSLSSQMSGRGVDGFVDADFPMAFKYLPTAPLPDREALEAYMDKEQLNKIDERALERLWTQGAWYNTRQKVASDRDGYVMNTRLKLVPGQIYVLYLWSQSRDDLAPDARFVFKAQAGITDLGALRLPSYR